MKLLAIAGLVILSLALAVTVFAATSETASPMGASTYSKSRSLTWYTATNVTASGNTQLLAAVTGKKHKVLAYDISSNNDVKVTFQSGTNQIYGATYWSSTAQWGVTKDPHWTPTGWPVVRFQTNAGEALNVNLSGAAASGVSVSVGYFTEE